MIDQDNIVWASIGAVAGALVVRATRLLAPAPQIDIYGPEPRPEAAQAAPLPDPCPYDYERLAACAGEYSRANKAWEIEAALSGVPNAEPDHPRAAGQYGSPLRRAWLRRRQALMAWEDELLRYTSLLRTSKDGA